MEAYVVNLDSRPDRWADIQARFKGSRMNLTRVRAVPHAVGTYGNLQSFLKVIRRAQREGLPSVLILEDDAVPMPQGHAAWASRWEQIREWLDAHPDEWEIFTGGAWGGNSLFQDFTDALGAYPKEVGRTGSNILFRYPSFTLGAHWLYIPRRMYGRLLAHFSRLAFLPLVHKELGFDLHLGLFFKTISVYPFLAYQDSSYSNLKDTFMNRRSLMAGYEKRVGKRLTRKKSS